MHSQHFIEGHGQTIASCPPTPDVGDLKVIDAAKSMGIKVLVCNRISPLIQKLKSRLTSLILAVVGQDVLPKPESQSIEVGPDVTRIGVSVVELSPVDEFGLQNSGEVARTDGSNELVNAFGVKTTAESLEL